MLHISLRNIYMTIAIFHQLSYYLFFCVQNIQPACLFQGMTALHWGCSKGHLDAVKLLIEYQAFPNHMEMTEDR